MLGPIEQATIAGRTAYGEAGARWLPQLQITHIIAAACRAFNGGGRQGYDDNPQARLRRHLLIMGPPSTRKSTLAKLFLTDIAGAVTIPVRARTGGMHPVYQPITGQDVSWERLRGSVDQKGNVITPLLKITDYLYSSELPTYLGHDIPTMLEKADKLNVMLEEGEMSTSLVKSAGEDARKAFEKAQDGLESQGIRADPEAGLMEYDVRLSAIACSRWFEPEEEKALTNSGFLSRWFVSGHNPTREEHRDLLTRQLQPIPDKARFRLREFNEKLWRTSFGRIDMPPPLILRKIRDMHTEFFRDVEDVLGSDLRKHFSLRDVLDHTRIVTAHAIARAVQCADDTGEIIEIAHLKYEEEDVEWARQFISANHLQDIYSSQMRIAHEDPDHVTHEETLLQFWASHIEHPTNTGFTAHEFNDWMLHHGARIAKAGYHLLARLVERGWVVSGAGISKYRLSGRFQAKHVANVFPDMATGNEEPDLLEVDY